MKHTYWVICECCGKQFTARYPHAKTCSNACRMRKSREKKRMGGRSLHDLSDQQRIELQQILSISERSYNAIFSILLVHGAYAASGAIEATYIAIEAVLAQVEKQHG